jgi:AAA+ superfamily predicted ATPase
MSANLNMGQMMTLTMAPIIAQVFSSSIQTAIKDTKNIIIYVFNCIYFLTSSVTKKYLFKKFDTSNKIYIEMYKEINHHNFGNIQEMTIEATPLVWYLNTNIMMQHNKLKCAHMISSQENDKNRLLREAYTRAIQTTDKKQSIDTMYFVPFAEPTCEPEYQSLSSDGKKKEDDGAYKRNICDSILIDKDIIMDMLIIKDGLETKNGIKKYIVLKSDKVSLIDIGNFVAKVKDKYEEYCNNQKCKKIYIYNGLYNTPEYNCYDIDKYQTFDNLFFSQKNTIIKNLDKLKDISYFEKYGIKRKACFMFTGKPGCGKTAVASAIAQYTNRSLISIPISRSQFNSEIETIIYKRHYNGFNFKMDEVIFFLDEIDSIERTFKKINDDDAKDIEPFENIVKNNIVKIDENFSSISETVKNKNHDKLNTGIILSILDGSIDCDGMIIVATANTLEKLDPAIYRDGRLQRIEFDYFGRNEIVEMIEFYYKIKLTDTQKNKICNNKTVQSLTVKNLCISHIDDENVVIDNVIDEINELYAMKKKF